MNRKRAVIFAGLLFGLILASYLVSAQTMASDVSGIIDDFVKIIEPVAKNVLGDTPSGELLFAKVLFLIIILAIVWTALSRIDFFNENTWVLVVISIAVSVLSTRFLVTTTIVQTIILPYSTLGIAVTAGLPFVIYFLLVNVGFQDARYGIVRRMAWIFFTVIFIGLWISRRDVMGDAKWIYPITALAAFIMAVMDGTIHRFFVKMQVEKIAGAGRSNLHAIQQLEGDIVNLSNLVTSGVITPQEAARREKKYKKQLAYLYK